jgi:hypothetical protein
MAQQILLTFTFVFGVISLLTYTSVFQKIVGGFFHTIYWKQCNKFFKWLDLMIFIISLMYQSWYWLFSKH